MRPIKVRRYTDLAVAGMLWLCAAGGVAAGGVAGDEPTRAQQWPALLHTAIPVAMDMMRRACTASVEARGIEPVAVADLPEDVRRDFQEVFPACVLDHAKLYFDVPFLDASGGVGVLAWLGMLTQGGGLVLAMTFEDDVFLFYPRESLAEGPGARTILAHELVHVAQYQALGYETYKRNYAEDLANGLPYERIRVERDAYLVGRLFPNLVPPGFFAFLEGPRAAVQVRVSDGGWSRLLSLEALEGLRTEEVTITASYEALPRRALLVLGRTGEPQVSSQILDPLGGPPLHELKHVLGDGALLAFNEAVMDGGAHLVAVGADDGIEAVWRQLDGFRSQWIPGPARFADDNGDGVVEVVQPAEAAGATWWWVGNGFVRVPLSLRDASSPGTEQPN